MPVEVKKAAACCGATLALLPFVVIGIFVLLHANPPDEQDAASCITDCYNKFSVAGTARHTRSVVKRSVNPFHKRFCSCYFEGVAADTGHGCREVVKTRCYASCRRNNLTDILSQYSVLLDKYCSVGVDNETMIQFWDQLTEANARLGQHFIDCGKKYEEQVTYERNATENEIICKAFTRCYSKAPLDVIRKNSSVDVAAMSVNRYKLLVHSRLPEFHPVSDVAESCSELTKPYADVTNERPTSA